MNNSYNFSLPRVALYSYSAKPPTDDILFKSEFKGLLGIFYTLFGICVLIVIRYLLMRTVLKNVLTQDPTKKNQNPTLITLTNLKDIEDGKQKESFVNN